MGDSARGGYRRTLGDLWECANAWDPTSPDTFYRSNLPPVGLASVAIAATGILTNARIHLRAGDIVTNIGFTVGSTAGGTMTHWAVALYSDAATPALLGQSADQTSAALAAGANVSLPLATAYTVPKTAIYRAALFVTATTIPTLLGSSYAPSGWVTGAPTLAESSGSGLTTTAPATIATPTALTVVPRFWVS
jgi:hypothetical protein